MAKRKADTVQRYSLRLVREQDAPYGETEPPLCTPEVAARFMWSRIFEHEPREVMAAVFLDTRHRPIGHIVAYAGGINRCACEPRGILVPAMLANAASVLVAHNHPSGDPTPSPEDVSFARRMRDAGDVVGVRVLDQFVIGGPDAVRSLSHLL